MREDIEKVYLSIEQEEASPIHYEDAYTDVIVQMKNGDVYAASFFTYKSLETIRKKHQLRKRFLSGQYFWANQLVVIQDCSRKMVEAVIRDLLEEGNFQSAFRKL